MNVYGVSKVAAEQLVRATHANHLIVRSSNLLGIVSSRKGWTFPEMVLRRAKAGECLRVVSDQHMAPTYTFDLVQTVVALLQAGSAGTVHVTNKDGCRWHEFACATPEIAGIDCAVEAKRVTVRRGALGIPDSTASGSGRGSCRFGATGRPP